MWEEACQLVAKNGDQWVTLDQSRRLPVPVPRTAEELADAAADPLRLTAYQYVCEHPGSDLEQLLAKRKTLDAAMLDASPTAA